MNFIKDYNCVKREKQVKSNKNNEKNKPRQELAHQISQTQRIQWYQL